jgi:ribosomal protein L10
MTYLAGVVVIGEAVDDGHVAVLREVQDVLVTKDARHNDVIEAAENARDILGGLALAQLDGVRPEVKGVASEKVEALSYIPSYIRVEPVPS